MKQALVKQIKDLLGDEHLMKVTTMAISNGNHYMITDKSGIRTNVLLPKNQLIIDRFCTPYHHVFAYRSGEILILKGEVPYHVVSNKGNRRVAFFIL